MGRIVPFIVACLFCTGCASLIPLTSVLTTPSSAPPPLQVHDETHVDLAKDNFFVVKTNVVGTSRGFSLLGIITIVPATLNKALNHLYAAAEMQQGRPQTVAHLIIEHTSTYWIMFGIPELNARADIVEFKPGVSPASSSTPGESVRAPPPKHAD
jgi:hypothetical protein